MRLPSVFRSLLVVALLCLAVGALAADAFMPRWPAITPDGGTVVFSYQGDLWSVPAAGGQARRLTAHEAYDSHAVISPDGKTIAFSSNRYGDFDVYVMPLEGGAPKRLTHAASNDQPRAFSADGTEVYFASRRLFDYPMSTQIFRVPVAGGTPFRLLDVFADEIATADGKSFVYAEGRVAWGRLHYRGSYQRELYGWTPGSDPIRLTDNRGYDTNPMVGPGGRIYWLGDQDKSKTANVWTMGADGSDPWQITEFKGDPVRGAALSADGRRMVLEQGTALFLLDLPDGKPKPIAISVADDQIENPVVLETKTGDATEIAVSSDGEEYALAVSGEIVLVNKELGGRATVAVPGPWLEQSLMFRPGSADTLLFVGDRDGESTVCLLVSDEEEQPLLRAARTHRIVVLTDGKKPCLNPVWSPKGDRILYTRGNGDLHVMDAEGGHDKTLFKSWNVEEYSWSPDGHWIAFSRSDRNYNSDIFIMPSDGGDEVNVSRHPDYDQNPVWSADGRVLAWSTARHDHDPNSHDQDVYAVYLQREDHERTKEEWQIWEKTRDNKDNKDKKGKKDEDEEEDAESEDEAEEAEEKVDEPAVIDFEDIHLRSRRITSLNGSESIVAVHPKGDRYYFVGTVDGDRDLMSVDRFGEDRESVTEGGTSPAGISADAEVKTFTFLKRGKPSRVPADGGKVESTDFSARLTVDRPAVRLRTMDEAWRTMRDHFYDPDMHGVDWDKVRTKYAAMVRGVRHDMDFSDVMNFMLGELNASHMGYRATWDTPGDYGPDGWLGLQFDSAHRGDGLLVTDVLAYGPCDMAKGRVEVGDLLLTVDGEAVSAAANLWRTLETREDQPTLLGLRRGADELDVEVVPASYRRIWQRNYERMERDKRSYVERTTNERIGYTHIQGMGFSEVERFEQNLFAAADGKEALIIDVRNNGGGWTTDLMLTILTQPQHAYTIGRDGVVGYPEAERQPFYRWTKPIVVICNEGSYSNAEIFSHAVKTIGRGEVVGMETGGNVISTGGFGNRYAGYVRLPGRGWYVFGDEAHPERNHKPQEAAHELEGMVPDHIVDLTPSDRLHGRDPQLDKAIEVGIRAADVERSRPQPEDSPHLK